MREVLQLGDERLRRVCAVVTDVHDPDVRAAAAELIATLRAFRARHGFGRAIAAPQIGVMSRMIAVDLGAGPFLVVNPEVTWRSDATVTMWDDCMSFPDLLVRVRRHRSLSLRYVDERGVVVTWERLDLAAAELLQHEIDHLDGVLAVDRALDAAGIVTRAEFAARATELRGMVDYVIGEAV